MATFSQRVFAALDAFDHDLAAFTTRVTATRPDPTRLTSKRLANLLEIADRAGRAATAIRTSFTLIEQTALDIVDMQVRLQGESARLASALRALGEAVNKQHFVREAFADALIPLDETAHQVASAVFPSAVQGLREVNVRLWDFEKVQWKRYTDLLTTVVQSHSMTSAQQAAVQRLADDVAAAFADVNTLLNDLAESRASDAAALQARLDAAPSILSQRLQAAEASLRPAFADFAPIIKASRKVATDVAKLLKQMVIPVYPTHDRLGECGECMAAADYDQLSGVQMFALLNILARMQATTANGRPVLKGRNIRVVQVFPDRLYLEADATLIADMKQDPVFKSAPASLHRFKDGSFKQSAFRKGNLQVCYEKRPGGRVMVDADIDLYRDVVPHLFGEVLVNHLTGSTTSQYAVREILDAQQIAPIGGFRFLPERNA